MLKLTTGPSSTATCYKRCPKCVLTYSKGGWTLKRDKDCVLKTDLERPSDSISGLPQVLQLTLLLQQKHEQEPSPRQKTSLVRKPIQTEKQSVTKSPLGHQCPVDAGAPRGKKVDPPLNCFICWKMRRGLDSISMKVFRTNNRCRSSLCWPDLNLLHHNIVNSRIAA